MKKNKTMFFLHISFALQEWPTSAWRVDTAATHLTWRHGSPSRRSAPRAVDATAYRWTCPPGTRAWCDGDPPETTQFNDGRFLHFNRPKSVTGIHRRVHNLMTAGFCVPTGLKVFQETNELFSSRRRVILAICLLRSTRWDYNIQIRFLLWPNCAISWLKTS